MGEIKVEIDDPLELDRSINELQVDIKYYRDGEQPSDTAVKEEFHCYNNRIYVTERTFETTHNTSGVTSLFDQIINDIHIQEKKEFKFGSSESINQQNYSSDNQLPNEAKPKVDDEEYSTRALIKKEIEFVDVQEDKVIVDHLIHNEENICDSNGEDFEQFNQEVESKVADDKAINGRSLSIKKRRYSTRSGGCSTTSRIPSATSRTKLSANSGRSVARKKTYVRSKQKNFKCQMCQYGARRTRDLEAHVNAVHVKSAIFKCPTCEFIASRKCDLSVHINDAHSKSRNYKCPMCDYVTIRRIDLDKHVGARSDRNDHKCSICDYKTEWKCGLRAHEISVHSERGSFKCHLCNYRTSKKSDLASHVNAVHLKLKNHKCDKCGFKTNRESVLASHVKSVHLKLKNFKCEMCDYASNRKYRIKHHMEAVHLKRKKCRRS